jgi:hypothetical protein
VVKSAKFHECSPTTASMRAKPDGSCQGIRPGIPGDRRVERDDCGGQIRVPAGQFKGDVASHALSLAPMLWPADPKRTGKRSGGG